MMQSEVKNNFMHCAIGIEADKDIWNKLKKIYQSKGPARKAILLRQHALQRMDGGDHFRNHTTKFFDAVDKLSEMEVNINPNLLSTMLL